MIGFAGGAEVIAQLHDDGFTADFQLVGNDLLWIQEGFFIRTGEFAILEFHHVLPDDYSGEMIVFGIVAPYYSVKGVLLTPFESCCKKMAPVLLKKLKELSFRNTDPRFSLALLLDSN